MRSNGLALVVKKTLKHPKADDLLKAEFEAKIEKYKADGKSIATLSGHTDTVVSAAFSPDGQCVVWRNFAFKPHANCAAPGQVLGDGQQGRLCGGQGALLPGEDQEPDVGG
jgi:hypothetical protein